jgi:hypothetical protein
LRVSDLSEQVMITYLQEKIKKIKRDEKGGVAVSIFGILLITFSVVSARFIAPVLQIFSFFGLIGGVLIIILGLSISIYFAVQGGVLLKHQKNSAYDLTIPNAVENCREGF